MTQVAHHLEHEEKDFQETYDMYLKEKEFFINTKREKVEIIKRSGSLVRVRILKTPLMYWTVERAVTCY